MHVLSYIVNFFDLLGMGVFYVASICGMVLIIGLCLLVTAIALLAMWKFWKKYYKGYSKEFAI